MGLFNCQFHCASKRRNLTYLIQNDEGVLCGIIQDVCHLVHLAVEGGHVLGKVVTGTDSGKQTVHDAQRG